MKILVIRFRQIGDAILSSAICSSLRESFPNAQIDYVLYENIAPLFKYNKNIDNIISIDKKTQKNGFRYLKKVFEIRKTKYDIIIDIMSTPKSEWFTFLSGAKYKIGRFKKYRGLTYTNKIKEDNSIEDKIQRFLTMLKPLEKEYDIKYNSDFSLVVNDDEVDNMKSQMVNKGISFNRPIIAFSVTALREGKVYPRYLMTKTIELILKEFDIDIVLFGTAEQKNDLESMYNSISNNSSIFYNIETKSIRELLALFKNCDMYFGNEGGARHMAHALDIPSIGIFSPGVNKNSWIPQNNGEHIGIMPSDINSDFQNLTREEIFSLITPKILLEKFRLHFKSYINSKN